MIIIRPVELVDIPQILNIYGPIIKHSATSFEWEVPSPAVFKERICDITAQFPFLVCQAGSKLAGYAYAGRHRFREAYKWSAELSVYIDPGFHRRGIATGLYQSIMAILKAQGYRNALAGITLPNDASVAFHENFGFQHVGIYHQVGFKFANWHSVGWWELSLSQSQEAPSAPLTFAEVQQLDNWPQLLQSGKPSIIP